MALPPGSDPREIAIDTTTDTVYVVDTSADEISVINGAGCNATNRWGCTQTSVLLADPSRRAIVGLDGDPCPDPVASGCGQTVKTVHVGAFPDGIAVDPVTDTVYVTNRGDTAGHPGHTVSVIDGATCNGVASSGCGRVATLEVGQGPGWIALDDATRTAYTANQAAGTVSVINMAICDAADTSGCGQRTPTIAVGQSPFVLTIDQELHTAYVASSLHDTVSVVDLDAAACRRQTRLPLGLPHGQGQRAGLGRGRRHRQSQRVHGESRSRDRLGDRRRHLQLERHGGMRQAGGDRARRRGSGRCGHRSGHRDGLCRRQWGRHRLDDRRCRVQRRGPGRLPSDAGGDHRRTQSIRHRDRPWPLTHRAADPATGWSSLKCGAYDAARRGTLATTASPMTHSPWARSMLPGSRPTSGRQGRRSRTSSDCRRRVSCGLRGKACAVSVISRHRLRGRLGVDRRTAIGPMACAGHPSR